MCVKCKQRAKKEYKNIKVKMGSDTAIGSEMYNRNYLILSVLKRLVVVLVVYFIGFFQFSITWVVVPALIDLFRYHNKSIKEKKRDLIRKIAHGSEQEVLETIRDLPAWVYFPDIDRVEWLNRIIKQLWPNVNHFARDLIKKRVEEKLRENLEKYKIPGFSFERLIIGNVPFRLGGIIVYENISRDEIVMDMDVSYAGDCDINFRLSKMKGGIKNIQLYGTLRVVAKPLINTLPLVGGLQVFFMNPPEIEFDLEGIAGVLEFPGLKEILNKIISDTVSSLLVLPNKFPIQLNKHVSSQQINAPNPKGVLRIHLPEAKNLMKKDISITGKGKSDPYAVLVIGDQKFKTHTINNSINPKWDFWCEFIIEEIDGPQLYIHLWDKDATEDESLGKTSIDVSSLANAGHTDTWLNLDEAKHGQIHLRSTWLSLTKSYEDLETAVNEIKQLQVTSLHSALLIIFIDSAVNLPHVKTLHKPDPYVALQVGKQEKRTKTKMKQINPVWEEGFIFFIDTPELSHLSLKVMDSKTNTELGEVIYNISNLSENNDLEIIQQPFRLMKSGSESKITWSLQMKIFKNENQRYFDEENLSKITKINEDFHTENQIEHEEISNPEPPLYQKENLNLSMEKLSIASNTSLLNEGENNILDSKQEFDDKANCVERNSQAGESDQEFRDNLQEFLEHPRTSTVSTTSVESMAFLHGNEEINSVGKICISLRYSVHRQKLMVTVHNIENLFIKDYAHLRAIYVKLYLLPDRSKETKRKTQMTKKCTNPSFEESFEYLISHEDICTKQLEISVLEEKRMKNMLLGEVLIDLDRYSLVISHTEWFELMPKFKNKK